MIGKRILFVLLWTFLYAVGLALSMIVFFGLAFFTDHIRINSAIALLFFFTSIGLISWLLCRKKSYARMATCFVVLTIPPLAFVVMTVFRPVAAQDTVVAPRSDTQFWDLSTGSRIAYSVIPAVGAPKPFPLVYLHGGPGSAISPTEYAFYKQFAEDGFTVYLYDQVGSGVSARLDDMRQYTVQRDIDDLEAIRKKIGAEQIILASQSWGGVLASRYMVSYPQRVAKAIFVSPGELWNLDRFPLRFDRTANAAFPDVINPPIRFFFALVLLRINPNAAQNLLPQAEIANYMQSLPPVLLNAQNYCLDDVERIPTEGTIGTNPYVNQLVQADKARLPDPRQQLKTVTSPILVLHGDCDFIPLEARQEYTETFPHATLVILPQTGHAIIGTQPILAKKIMQAFLFDQPIPTISDTAK